MSDKEALRLSSNFTHICSKFMGESILEMFKVILNIVAKR